MLFTGASKIQNRKKKAICLIAELSYVITLLKIVLLINLKTCRILYSCYPIAFLMNYASLLMYLENKLYI